MSKAIIKLLVDRSGSMAGCKESAETGIEEFLNERRKDKDIKQWASLDDFDTEYQTVYDFVEIDNAPKYILIPRGMTALHDSIAKAIKSLEDFKPDKDHNRFLVIMTDGFENASKEHTKASVKALLEKKQAEGWTVIYLGANQDAIAVGESIGIPRGSSMTYDVNSTAGALTGTSFYVSSVTRGKSYNFTDEDRDRSIGKK